MATTVDTLLVRIEADLSDLNRGLKKVKQDVDKSSKGITASFKKIGKAGAVALAAIAVQQAARAGAAFISLGSDIEEMQGKSKVVFGAFRSQVVKDLEAFGDSIGRSTHELEGMASSIQDTFVPMGFARGEAAKLSVDLTKLAVDVASFNNASDTETMAAFQSALVGNHETVRKFGVIITAVTLDQELMRMGIEKGSKTATEAQKVQARMNLIIRGTTDAAGDAARTSGSFANQARALKAELSELGGELSAILLPAVTDIVSTLLAGAKAAKSFLVSIGALSQFGTGIEGVALKIAFLRSEIESLVPATRFKMNDQFAIDGKKRLIETLELQLKAQKALKAAQNTAGNQSGGPGVPFVPVSFEPSAALMAGVAELALMREQITLQAKLTAAKKSGNDVQVVIAQKALESMNNVDQLTEEQIQKEFKLTRARAGSNGAMESTISLMDGVFTLSLQAHKGAYDDLIDSMADYQAKAEKGKETALNEVDENLSIKRSIEDIKAAMDSGLISVAIYKEALAELQSKMVELSPMTEALQSAVSSMSQSLSNSFADMLTSGKMNMDSLKDIFRGFVKMMIAKAIELFIVNKLLNMVFASTGMPALPVGSFGAKASGGTVQAKQPYMVGERGPELFVPSSAGTVMNNSNSKGSSGMATIINQTINVSAGVSQTVRAEMMSLLPKFKQDTMLAVVDAKRRGGSYGAAFG